MNISWSLLEQWAKGWKMPVGFKLEYEFRPSMPWHPDIHTVHAFWIAQNPDEERTMFWHLEKEEQEKVTQQYLQAKYKQFTLRDHRLFEWQRFKLTDVLGKSIILQMDSRGHVVQLKPVTVTETYDTLEVVQ